MKVERSIEFVETETVISLSEYLLLLCRTLEAVEQNDKGKVTETTGGYIVA